MEKEFAGCGGSHDANKATFKLQAELELRSGAVTVAIEPGRRPDPPDASSTRTAWSKLVGDPGPRA
jgi:hypothetical protein